jgi:hypothetical protein
MPRHRRRSHKRSRSHRKRNYKGGNYTSASTYGSYVNGDPESQFARTFDTTGPYAGRMGTEYVGAQGQWGQALNVPNSENLSLIQSAGRKRRHSRGRKTKSKRGGVWGEVLNQAVVPFSLFALQNRYRKNSTRKNK